MITFTIEPTKSVTDKWVFNLKKCYFEFKDFKCIKFKIALSV